MNLVFNKLSANYNSLCNIYEIKSRINNFVNTIHENYANIEIITSDQSIYNFMINNIYGIQEWLKDSEIEKSKKDFLRSVFNRKIAIINEEDFVYDVYFKCGNEKIQALCGTVALEQNCPIISINTDIIWGNDTIEAEYNNTSKVLANIANSLQFSNQMCTYHNLTYNEISSGQDLWERREELFADLIFCDPVKAQLYKDPQINHIQQIISKLKLLNDYYNNYNYYLPSQLGHDARTESESVKNDPNLKKERHFKKPDGSYEYFFDHITFNGNYSGRIHFLPDDKNKKMYIGYIGKHLPTKKF